MESIAVCRADMAALPQKGGLTALPSRTLEFARRILARAQSAPGRYLPPALIHREEADAAPPAPAQYAINLTIAWPRQPREKEAAREAGGRERTRTERAVERLTLERLALERLLLQSGGPAKPERALPGGPGPSGAREAAGRPARFWAGARPLASAAASIATAQKREGPPPASQGCGQAARLAGTMVLSRVLTRTPSASALGAAGAARPGSLAPQRFPLAAFAPPLMLQAPGAPATGPLQGALRRLPWPQAAPMPPAPGKAGPAAQAQAQEPQAQTPPAPAALKHPAPLGAEAQPLAQAQAQAQAQRAQTKTPPAPAALEHPAPHGASPQPQTPAPAQGTQGPVPLPQAPLEHPAQDEAAPATQAQAQRRQTQAPSQAALEAPAPHGAEAQPMAQAPAPAQRGQTPTPPAPAALEHPAPAPAQRAQTPAPPSPAALEHPAPLRAEAQPMAQAPAPAQRAQTPALPPPAALEHPAPHGAEAQPLAQAPAGEQRAQAPIPPPPAALEHPTPLRAEAQPMAQAPAPAQRAQTPAPPPPAALEHPAPLRAEAQPMAQAPGPPPQAALVHPAPMRRGAGLPVYAKDMRVAKGLRPFPGAPPGAGSPGSLQRAGRAGAPQAAFAPPVFSGTRARLSSAGGSPPGAGELVHAPLAGIGTGARAGGAAASAAQAEPGAQAGPAPYTESAYVRSLPNWARDFLKDSFTHPAAFEPGGDGAQSGPPGPGAPNAQSGPGRPDAAAPPQAAAYPPLRAFQKEREPLTAWAAPGYAGPAPKLTHKKKEKPQEPLPPPRFTDAEINRMADRVYGILTERIKRDRRRMGL